MQPKTDTTQDPATELADTVWIIGNRLTGFDTKKEEILAACRLALSNARAEGYADAKN